jgi:uncharacterized membrane protein
MRSSDLAMFRLARRRLTHHMMIGGYLRALTMAGIVGAGLMAGVYFAFSTFVMAGIRRLRPEQGLVAMQEVNRAAPTPLFMLLLLGTGALSVVLAVVAVRRLDGPAQVWVLVGAAAYLVSLVVTIAYHVPRNNALDRVDPNSAGAVAAWLDYAGPWVAVNHVRTAGALASCLAFVVALTR